MDGKKGFDSVEEEESLQAMPSRSVIQMSGSNTKIGVKRGLVSVEKEEASLQAMPGTSALQMSGSNTKIDGKRGLVSVEEEEESLQAMPGEVIQQ